MSLIKVTHIRSQVKRRQSQIYKVKKKIAKNSNFEILQETLHATHLLKLPDKMYKYEYEKGSIQNYRRYRVDTGDAGQMDRPTDGRTEWNQYTPNNFVVQGV